MQSNKTTDTIGGRIKMLRERAELTQEALAKKLYISREKVNMWENGSRMIKGDDIAILADALKSTCDYLLRGVESDQLDINSVTALSGPAIFTLKYLTDEHRKRWGGVLSALITHPQIMDALYYYLNYDIDSAVEWNADELAKGNYVPTGNYKRLAPLADSKKGRILSVDASILGEAILLSAMNDIRKIKEKRKEEEKDGEHK